MQGDGHLRAGDAQRAAALEVLAAGYADGRLSRQEHDRRVAAALDAATIADLRLLLTDLPPPPAHLAAVADARARRWRTWLVGSVVMGVAWLSLVVAGDGLQALWPAWISGVWAIVVAARGARERRTGLP